MISSLTRVPFAPLWFLVAVCLLYTALGLGVAAAALMLRRQEHYAEVQARLLPKIAITLGELLKNCWDKISELTGWKDKSKKDRETWQRAIVARFDG